MGTAHAERSSCCEHVGAISIVFPLLSSLGLIRFLKKYQVMTFPFASSQVVSNVPLEKIRVINQLLENNDCFTYLILWF